MPLTLPSHRNPGLELVYQHRGGIRWEVEGRVATAGPGQLFFTLPWQRHGSFEERIPGGEWFFVVLAVTGGQRRSAKSFGLPDPYGLPDRVVRPLARRLVQASGTTLPTTDRFRVLIRELVSLATARLPAGTQPRHRAQEAVLAAALFLELEACLSLPSWKEPVVPVRVRRWLSETRNEPAESFSLDRAARQCGLGRSQFSHWVRRRTGDAPGTYVHRMRCRLGSELLRQTNRTVTDIAHACGYPSSQYFARVFRRFQGCTPTAWRSAGGNGAGPATRR